MKNFAKKTVMVALSLIIFLSGFAFAQSDDVVLGAPYFSAFSPRSKPIEASLIVNNFSSSDFLIEEISRPDWIVLEEPQESIVRANSNLVVPFSVDSSVLPDGWSKDVIQVRSSSKTLEFKVRVFLNDSWNVLPEGLFPDMPVFPEDGNIGIQDVGDDCCNAETLFFDTSQFDYINWEGDVDFWQFYAYNEVDVIIYLNVPAGHDYDLKIYGGCTGDCVASPYLDVCQENGSEECVFTPYANQDYYIKVYAADFSWSPTDAYGISIVEAPTCNNECPYQGAKQCNGTYSQTCDDYDPDTCLEWGGDVYCPNGCDSSSGQCINCSSHAYSACYEGDRWWYNSCDIREDEIREYCGDDYYGPWYCCESNTSKCRDVTERGCSNDTCTTNSYVETVFCEAGCSGGSCNACESHAYYACDFELGDLYWYDSCDVREDIYDDCRVTCVNDGGNHYCIDGCLGYFDVTVKNEFGQVEPNATVSIRDQTETEFRFAGLTDSEGKLYFSDLGHGNFCGLYEVKAVTASGGDCGTRFTMINEEGDVDGVMFNCPLVDSDHSIFVLPNIPELIDLGEILEMMAVTRDELGNLLEGVLVGVIRPYDPVPLSDTSNASGETYFSDPFVPAGSHNVQFVGSKVGYNYDDAWAQVTVVPKQVVLFVKDSLGNPVWHAEAFLEGQSVGFTGNDGFLTVQVTEPLNTFEVKNTQSISCGFKTIQIGEQANFICGGNAVLRVDVDSNYGHALANVVVAVDGNFIDFTNSFGFVKTSIPAGTHDIEIYYQLDENRDIFTQKQILNVDSNELVLGFIASEENGEIVENANELTLNANVNGEAIPVLIIALVVVAWQVFDHLSPVADVYFLCECVADNSSVEEQTCVNTMLSCINPGETEACVEEARAVLTFPEECHLDYLAIGIDALPGIAGAGIVKKVASEVSQATGKIKFIKLPETAQNIMSFAKNKTDDATAIVGHNWDYFSKWLDDQSRHLFQIVLQVAGKLSEESTQLIETAARSAYYGETIAYRVLQGIDSKVIPDSIDHITRLLEYVRISLSQGFEPFADGIHKLQKLYKKEGINTAVGNDFVFDTVVLKKGNSVWGYDHIFVLVREDGLTRSQQIIRDFPDSFRNEDDVLNAIKQVIEEGVPTPNNPNSYRLPFPSEGGQMKYLEVWLATAPEGSIGTIVNGGPV